MDVQMQLRDWMVDAELFNVDVCVARDVFLTLSRFLEAHWHEPQRLWACLGLLSKIVNNVVQCANSLDKFRYRGACLFTTR